MAIVEVLPSRVEKKLMKHGKAWVALVHSCADCGRSCSYKGLYMGESNGVKQYYQGVWADTNREAFKNYLCYECKDK